MKEREQFEIPILLSTEVTPTPTGGSSCSCDDFTPDGDYETTGLGDKFQ